MTTREIAAHIGELYGTEISPDMVSAVTDAVLEEVAAWHQPTTRRENRLQILAHAAVRAAARVCH